MKVLVTGGAGYIDYKDLYLKNVESIAGRLLGLPNHPKLKRKQLDKVLEILLSINKY